jgi:acyl carrier protein
LKQELPRENIQEWLLAWFASRGKIGPQGNGNLQTDYFAAGWLTSMEVVEFVTEIEDRFAMRFSDQDLQDARFVTIGGLAELILKRSTQTSESR